MTSKSKIVGVSVEDQKTADERIPSLLQTPAAVRWISAEPLLGAINLSGLYDDETKTHFSVLEKSIFSKEKIDWVVVGGESASYARPSHPDWFRQLRNQCVAADVPFFFKQWGEWIAADELEEQVALPLNKWAWKNFNGDTDQEHTKPFKYAFDHHILMAKIGKKKAGWILDGQIWREYPPCKK